MKSKINSIKPLAETKYLSLYDAEYTNKNGKVRHWTIASRKDKETLNAQTFCGMDEKVDAVIIAAFHKDYHKLVLVKQFRVPVNDYVYELPAGLIDGEEKIFDAVGRELLEETGLKITSIDEHRSFSPVYVSCGMTDESVSLVYCTCEGEPSTKYLEEDEDLEIVLVSPEEANEIINSKAKFDIKAFLVLQHLSLQMSNEG